MDSAPAQSAGVTAPAIDPAIAEPDYERCLTEFSGLAIDEFWQEAHADSVDLTKEEMARVLLTVGARYNYGLPAGAAAGRTQVGAFWRGLQLADLALAQACALGRDAAWLQFMNRFRDPLTRAAIAIAGSSTVGEELADALYSEMFGITERNGRRHSPLAGYSGRGSLMGFLRATLSQRNVDHHRRTGRETPLASVDMRAAARPTMATMATMATSDSTVRLIAALTVTLGALEPEERFILSAWFLDQRTLLEISRVIGVHEATVSRRLQRLTSRLHRELLSRLESSGLSRSAAEESLGTEPGDLDINLRSLLQASRTGAFPERGGPDRT